MLLWSSDFFSKFTFSKNSFKNTIKDGSRSEPTFCAFSSGFKLFAKVISRRQKSQLAKKELKNACQATQLGDRCNVSSEPSYMSMLCFILAAKALVRMHICGGWSEHWLLTHVISTKIHVMASIRECSGSVVECLTRD